MKVKEDLKLEAKETNEKVTTYDIEAWVGTTYMWDSSKDMTTRGRVGKAIGRGINRTQYNGMHPGEHHSEPHYRIC